MTPEAAVPERNKTMESYPWHVTTARRAIELLTEHRILESFCRIIPITCFRVMDHLRSLLKTQSENDGGGIVGQNVMEKYLSGIK